MWLGGLGGWLLGFERPFLVLASFLTVEWYQQSALQTEGPLTSSATRESQGGADHVTQRVMLFRAPGGQGSEMWGRQRGTAEDRVCEHSGFANPVQGLSSWLEFIQWPRLDLGWRGEKFTHQVTLPYHQDGWKVGPQICQALSFSFNVSLAWVFSAGGGISSCSGVWVRKKNYLFIFIHLKLKFSLPF